MAEADLVTFQRSNGRGGGGGYHKQAPWFGYLPNHLVTRSKTACCTYTEKKETFWIYSQTSLIHASLIRLPHNPNTLPGNLFYHFLFTVIQ